MYNNNNLDFTPVEVCIDISDDETVESTAKVTAPPKTLEEIHAEHPDDIPAELRCAVRPLNSLKDYKYVVVCTFYGEQIVLSRHRNRETWETQGGHIEDGETPLEAAVRELYEESGIRDAEMTPICDYYGYTDQSHANGMVFAARVSDIGPLPLSEMGEVRLFDKLPDASQLTYANVTPKLFAEAKTVLERAAEEQEDEDQADGDI